MISGAEVILLITVWTLGETFAGLAAELPFASEKTIKKQMARCQKDFSQALLLCVERSPAAAACARLLQDLPGDVVERISSFCD